MFDLSNFVNRNNAMSVMGTTAASGDHGNRAQRYGGWMAWRSRAESINGVKRMWWNDDTSMYLLFETLVRQGGQ